MDASVYRIHSSKDEKAFLVSLRLPEQSEEEAVYSLDELKLLVKTAGGVVMGSRIVKRPKIDSSFITGKGFWEDFKIMIKDENIKMVVLDINNLRPGQVRNIEEEIKIRVLGRTEIILDIFACRARSKEAQMQVELAKLHYILPRLKGYGSVLSRQGGGIGTRGPGEKMLEKDKRHIQNRISLLKNNLKKIESHRERTRKNRQRAISCAVAGYTNAGKSTLINALAGDDLFVENRLFATLDAYTRTAYLGFKKNILLTDTVGFIRNLPTHLVASFRSTLEEIRFADIILHVVDIASIDIETNILTVEKELQELEIKDKPVILYFNKSDSVPPETAKQMTYIYPGSICGSSVVKGGLTQLKEALNQAYDKVAEAKYPHYLQERESYPDK
jgi:GTP-binding protein HflX